MNSPSDQQPSTGRTVLTSLVSRVVAPVEHGSRTNAAASIAAFRARRREAAREPFRRP